jgi:hypothetical protein
MALGRILKAARPAPRKPAPVKPTPVKPPTNIYSKRPGMPEIGFPAIPSPGAPRMISPGPTPPSGGATGSTGFKSAFGGIDSNMLAPSGGAPGNTSDLARAASAAGVSKTPYMGGLPQTPQPNSARLMMKKGGEVKASKAPKASSASKRGDGIATKGKTKGRFV